LVKGTGNLLRYTYAGKSHTSEEKQIVCYLKPVHIEEWGKQLHAKTVKGQVRRRDYPLRGGRGQSAIPNDSICAVPTTVIPMIE
jgi:hypothetical protein